MSEEALSVIEFDDDIGNVEQPEPLPLSDYPFTIRGAEIKESQTSGRKYAAVSCYISPDDYPADYPVDNAPDGTTIIYRRVPLERDRPSQFRLRQWCEAIGAPTGARIDLNEWVGLGGMATIEHDEYEGVVRAVISRVKSE